MNEGRGGMVSAARKRWRIHSHLVGRSLGLVALLLTVAELGVAQTRWNPPGSTWGNPHEPFRLTVRREMATGTQTERAGEYQLDRGAPPAASEMMPLDAVVVPKQCVGTRRCPLVVWFGDAGPSSGDGPATSANFLFSTMRPLAERYGMIFLAPRYGDGEDHATNLGYLDAALQYVLQHFAIDPDKIAIAGRDGDWAAAVGVNNPDVFSRIVANSVRAVPDTQPQPQPKRPAEYLYTEDLPSDPALFAELRGENVNLYRLQERGFRVTRVVHLHGHEQREEDFAFTAHWLDETWTHPDPATRPQLPVVATPPLTPQALKQLTTFWTAFIQLPDSIRDGARQAQLREVTLQVGQEPVAAWLTDMAVLAAKYPAVAAALKAAGLSAAQHDAYRLALVGAYVLLGDNENKVPSGVPSVLAKNAEFVLGYGKIVTNGMKEFIYQGVKVGTYEGLYDPPRTDTHNELEALWATKMFRLP